MFLKQYMTLLLIPCLLAGSVFGNKGRDLMSDSWVATDGLGRTLSNQENAGPTRKNKFVGIFYLTWHGAHSYDILTNPSDEAQGIVPKTKKDYKSPYDTSEILKHEPGKRPWGPALSLHHFAEPEWGYYLSNDEFVIRKHIQMLADAGVDVIILDATNGLTYRDIYLNFCRILRKIRATGERTPKIAFMAHTSSELVVPKIYNDFYAKKLYSELWFYWKGKPLILSPEKGLNKKIRNFFTIRHTWVPGVGPWFGDGKDKWTFFDNTPQAYGWSESSNKPEQVSVTTAQHAHRNIGRSFQNGKQPSPENERPDEGIYFTEQWQRALEVDPEFILIIDWNEWTAMRFVYDAGDTNLKWEVFLGKQMKDGDSWFVDQYNQEFSRSIEPMKGGHYDSYYYQMIDNIRKYKGVRSVPKASAPKTITIDGKFDDWTGVGPEYYDTKGDVYDRDYPGWGRIKSYVNKTGRNDFKTLKVARDDKNIYFFAETDKDITSYKDKNRMMLFIDADADSSTGWEGYDYLINHKVIDSRTATIEKFEGTNKLSKIGKIKYRVNGNKLELAVPRKLIGLENKKNFTLDFHWADNIQKLFDITEFAQSGDSAPNRRFKYRYISK